MYKIDITLNSVDICFTNVCLESLLIDRSQEISGHIILIGLRAYSAEVLSQLPYSTSTLGNKRNADRNILIIFEMAVFMVMSSVYFGCDMDREGCGDP